MKKTMLEVDGKQIEVEALERKAQTTVQETDPFLKRVRSLRKEGYKEWEVADILGMTVVDMRKEISKRLREEREILVKKAVELHEAGESVRAIAIALGRNESSVRLLLSDIANN